MVGKKRQVMEAEGGGMCLAGRWGHKPRSVAASRNWKRQERICLGPSSRNTALQMSNFSPKD